MPALDVSGFLDRIMTRARQRISASPLVFASSPGGAGEANPAVYEQLASRLFPLTVQRGGRAARLGPILVAVACGLDCGRLTRPSILG